MKNRIIIIVFFAIFSCAPNNNLEILQESYELKLFNQLVNSCEHIFLKRTRLYGFKC